MKYVYALLIYIGLSTSAFGEDLKTECKWHNGISAKSYYFKYADNFLKDKAHMRLDGEWIDYCDGMMSSQNLRYLEKNRRITDYTVRDNSASCTFYGQDTEPSSGLDREGTQTWVVDFEVREAKVGFEERNPKTGETADFFWFNKFECKPY